MREGHPVLWSLAEPRPDGLLVLEYPYFEQRSPTVWDEGGTYVETDQVFTHNVTHEWNHGLGEIVTALFDAGLRVDGARGARLGAVGRAAGPDDRDRRGRVPPHRPARAAAAQLHAAGARGAPAQRTLRKIARWQ